MGRTFLQVEVSEESPLRVEHSQMPVFSMLAPANWSGKSILELHLRTEFGVNVIGIDDGSRMTLFPEPSQKVLGTRKMYCSIVDAEKFDSTIKSLNDIISPP